MLRLKDVTIPNLSVKQSQTFVSRGRCPRHRFGKRSKTRSMCIQAGAKDVQNGDQTKARANRDQSSLSKKDRGWFAQP